MGWIFVIESDSTFFDQIEEAVDQIEPKVSIVRFQDREGFLDWMSGLQIDPSKLLPAIPQGQFMGLITAVDSWKFRDVKLIGKFKALFIQKGLATNEDELGVVFTGYESEVLNKKRFESRSVNNFIYKPFDGVVLKQMIEIAFTGRHAIKKYFVHNQKIDAKIEMLKEVTASAMTEMGFRTVSDQDIAPGKISKYYAQFLETHQHRSALAQVLKVASRPGEATGLFNIDLRFFALDQQQSFNLQKMVREKSESHPLLDANVGHQHFEFIFVDDGKSRLGQELLPTAERFFDHPIRTVQGLEHLARELQNSQGQRFVFLERSLVYGNEVAEIQGILNYVKSERISIFLLSPTILKESLELDLSTLCEDIYYAPFNKSYLMKGLKQRWPAMRTKEKLVEASRTYDQIIHVSNPTKMVQVSEAGVVIEYYRDLDLGSFREFVFWMPNEASVPTLVAQCNFCAPVEGKKTFLCHFIFFGLHDVELKFIRLWMLHHYIESKQEPS